ncbi:hypothetical protein SOVF_153220 [Spinacia oleracea]|nr:hypothetical protein SOVF_153220 [Spinacia oleracea]
MLDLLMRYPNLSQEELKSRPVPEMERLSTLYNADVGLYMLANKWMVDEKELRVIHYTLGPLKPWDWWTALLVKPVDLWQSVSLVNVVYFSVLSLLITKPYKHTKQGPIIRQEFIVGPYETLCCQLKNRCCASFCCRLSFISHELQPAALLWFAIQSTLVSWRNISVCLLTVVISLGLALLIVPLQVLPWTRLLLMYEWTFTIFFLLFGGYLQHVYQRQKVKSSQAGSYSSDPESLDYDSGKGL